MVRTWGCQNTVWLKGSLDMVMPGCSWTRQAGGSEVLPCADLGMQAELQLSARRMLQVVEC